MLPLIIYGLVVFLACLFSIRLLKRRLPILIVVGLCTVISPVLMQGLNTLVIGYLDSSAGEHNHVVEEVRRLTNRWSGRVRYKVPSSSMGARAAELNR
jgi:hypothetical protein